MAKYAEVIVDIAHEKLDHPFSYRIPEELADSVRPGCVVEVPFGGGGRTLRGYVVGLSDQTAVPPEKMKAVIRLITDDETVEARLLLLAAWMSRNYGSTMIQALKTVVPVRSKVGAVVKRTVTLTRPEDAASRLVDYERRHCGAMARVMRVLMGAKEKSEAPGTGGMDQLRLQNEASVPASVVRRMAEDGVLHIGVSSELRRVVREAKTCPPDTLTGEQQYVVDEIRAEWGDGGRGRPVLLNGVTGSGKTLVYMELIADTLAAGKQAIVLIPEIALTWQTTLRFVARFGERVSFLHSRLSDGERYDQMKAARRGDISVMVGPRSALFTPFSDLGLIIIDEEHEESYHSETMPRYHARETAVKRAEIEHAHVLMGSATPSMTASHRVETGEYLGLRLESRFGDASLPTAEIVDMRKELEAGNRSIISERLRTEMTEALSRGEQIMLFLNRRGYTGAVTCRSCGHVMKCPHCDVTLTRHRNGMLICHYCGYEQRDVDRCPECGSKFIGGLTVGTEQVEDIIRRMFPEARVLRMDLDTTRGKEGHGRILRDFAEGRADILIGTQMIVKGHDFPNVTLVGVLLADLSLTEADYRSSEHTYQLVAQAVGRAGRGAKPGRAVIQTYRPDHFSIRTAAAQDYDAFYREEKLFRKIMEYPPEGCMCAILGSSKNERLLTEGMGYIRKYLDRIDSHGQLRTIGPAPQSVGKIRDTYRQVIYIRNMDNERLIMAKDRIEAYVAANRGFSDIRIQFDFNT
ncbi:MAG: primosomal protein N' [Eubacteriales bacterium]|jgi:primosomal protein N' (replication factor Y)